MGPRERDSADDSAGFVVGAHRKTAYKRPRSCHGGLQCVSANQSFAGRSPRCPETKLDNGKPDTMIDDVDGLASTASECQGVVAGKRHKEGDRP